MRRQNAFGIDGMEIRRRNLIKNNELPYRNWKGLSIDSGDFLANLERPRGAPIGRVSPRAAVNRRHAGKRRGRGISYYFEASGGPPRSRARQDPVHRERRRRGSSRHPIEAGRDTRPHFPQIVSERLGGASVGIGDRETGRYR